MFWGPHYSLKGFLFELVTWIFLLFVSVYLNPLLGPNHEYIPGYYISQQELFELLSDGVEWCER